MKVDDKGEAVKNKFKLILYRNNYKKIKLNTRKTPSTEDFIENKKIVTVEIKYENGV